MAGSKFTNFDIVVTCSIRRVDTKRFKELLDLQVDLFRLRVVESMVFESGFQFVSFSLC